MTGISVIIPLYNAGPYVAAALDSALAQTAKPREILVVDDGSTDDGPAIVERYAAQHPETVKLIRKANEGVSKARNVAFDASTGAFIAYLDADDLWLPDKLERQLALFEQYPDAIGTHTRCFNFLKSIDDRDREETEKARDDPSLADMILHHWVVTSSAMVRRRGLETFRYPEHTGHAEDMVLFADLRTLGTWRLVNEPLLAKRIHATQATAKPWHRLWAIETRLEWLRGNRHHFDDATYKQVERTLSGELVNYLEHRYWRRDLVELKAMIAFARRLSPQAMERSVLGRVRIWPRWVYAIRDRLKR